jgi:FixJ family two-component response regulator
MFSNLATEKPVQAPKPVIAIVDDDESVCRSVSRLFRSLGMNAETFASGQEFLDLVEAMPAFQPACLILDVQMPEVTGLEVQDQLTLRGSRFPVIFITAHEDIKSREKALAGGALAFLRKPFDPEVLVKTVREALNLRH